MEQLQASPDQTPPFQNASPCADAIPLTYSSRYRFPNKSWIGQVSILDAPSVYSVEVKVVINECVLKRNELVGEEKESNRAADAGEYRTVGEGEGVEEGSN